MPFIAIEGNDGSGKATQAKLLAGWLRRRGRKVAAFSFPRYGHPSAYFVEQYLAGNYGPLPEVPYEQSALFYALDRLAAAPEISAALARGEAVLSDRYTGSSMAHQGGKRRTATERRRAYQWIYDLELERFGLPKPDLNIVLLMPPELSQRLAHDRTTQVPLHEADLAQFRSAERAFREICREYPDQFVPVECAPSGQLRSITDIQTEIRNHIR